MENMCISGEVTCHMENMLKPLMLLIDGMWLTFSPPLLLYVKLHIIHKRISNWRMGGDFMHTMWCMTNPKRAKVTIACTALITPYREPTDTGYDMSPGKCGTYKIRYDITDMIWYRQDMILQARYDITGMIWYYRHDMIQYRQDMICTWLTYRRAVLYTLLTRREIIWPHHSYASDIIEVVS